MRAMRPVPSWPSCRRLTRRAGGPFDQPPRAARHCHRLRGAEARDHSRMQPQAKGAEEPKPAVPEFRKAPGEETWRGIDEARRVAKLEAREAAAKTRIQQRPRNLSRGELELASEVCSRHANC